MRPGGGPARDASGRFVSAELAADERWQAQQRRAVAKRERKRRRARTRERWRNVLEPVGFVLVVVCFLTFGVVMLVSSLAAGDLGGVGFGLVVVGFATAGWPGLIPAVSGISERGLAGELVQLLFVLIGPLIMCVGVAMMLVAGDATDRVGGGSRWVPLWVFAILVWGSTGAAIIAAVVNAVKSRRRARYDDTRV